MIYWCVASLMLLILPGMDVYKLLNTAYVTGQGMRISILSEAQVRQLFKCMLYDGTVHTVAHAKPHRLRWRRSHHTVAVFVSDGTVLV